MSGLAKAARFYELTSAKYQSDIGFTSILPHNKAQTPLFLQQFVELDEVQKQQWFDHLFKEANNNIQYENQLRTAREQVVLLLSTLVNCKLILTRDYNFEQIIKVLWIDYNFKGKDVNENIRKIYEDSGYLLPTVIDKRYSKKSGPCGCIPNNCDIF